MKSKRTFLFLLLVLASPWSLAQPNAMMSGIIDNANLVWIILAAVLVFFMQAGFALLESGSSRAKNSINVMMKNYFDVCMATVVFWLLGYGLMFGNSDNGLWGGSLFAFSEGSGLEFATLLFQAMFAATAATIASGAMAERTKFPGYILCATIITAVVYPIFGCWAWNKNGWLANLDFIDFAGSTVVHSVGGWVALAGVLVVGPRAGRFPSGAGEAREVPGHNLTLVALGGFVLWLGWFGFNCGSTLAATDDIGIIALNTHLAASAGAIGFVLLAAVFKRPVTLVGCVNGSLAGLVSITAGCASMEPGFALLTGLVGGMIVLLFTPLFTRMRVDDVVGAIPVHGVAGVWGTLAAGAFFTDDLFNPSRMGVQVIGVMAAFVWAFGASLLVFLAIRYTMGLRCEPTHEIQGLDFSEHSEVGYPEFHQLTQSYKG